MRLWRGGGASWNAIIAAGGAPYDDLIGRLRVLAKMAAYDGKAINDVLGLLLDAARDRAIKQRSARFARRW